MPLSPWLHGHPWRFKVARPAGVEPAANGLEVCGFWLFVVFNVFWRSINTVKSGLAARKVIISVHISSYFL